MTSECVYTKYTDQSVRPIHSPGTAVLLWELVKLMEKIVRQTINKCISELKIQSTFYTKQILQSDAHHMRLHWEIRLCFLMFFCLNQMFSFSYHLCWTAFISFCFKTTNSLETPFIGFMCFPNIKNTTVRKRDLYSVC